jgi:glycosyltransferase involved in cell wall biosynthesis
VINVLSVISDLNFGGGENRLFNMARFIDARRFRLTVATLYAPDRRSETDCGSMRGQFAQANVPVRSLDLANPVAIRAPRPLKLASTAATLAGAVAKLRQLMAATRADVVDAHLETALYTAVPAAASAGIPAAVTLYSELDLWRERDRRTYRELVFPAFRRFNLRLCSAVITDSDLRALELSRFIGRDAPSLHVVPNGVRLDAPTLPREEVLARFGIPPGTRAIILGQVAGLVPFKGQAVFLDAAKQVLDAGCDVYVLCVGYGRLGPAYPEELRRQAERLGIAPRVRIQSYPGNIADVWSAIDVHVHASSIDSLPNAIIEGMSLAKPAVVSAVGAIPDHVEDGRTGLLVPPGDASALAAALLRLLRDPGLAAHLGQAARHRYQERFTPEITIRRLEACFEELAARRAAA